MTGTGTAADPYIPTTFEEFKTAIYESDKYVSLPENLIWDMDEMFPGGITASGTYFLYFRCAECKCNGLTIKNLYLPADSNINKILYGKGDIYDFNLLNVDIRSSGATVVYNYTGALELYKSRFSGIINGAFYSTTITSTATFNRCAFNLKFNDTGKLGASKIPTYNNCLFKIDTSASGATTAAAVKINNCYISGKIKAPMTLKTGSTYSIINADVSDGAIGTDTSGITKVLYNSGKAVSMPENLVPVSEAQLKDAAYLSSIGFPIVDTAAIEAELEELE